MQPSDVVLALLLIQAFATGHGAVRLAYEYRLGLWRLLPLMLVVLYFVLASLWAPPGLKRDVPVTPELWHNTFRYIAQVLGFSVVIEGLLLALQQKEKG